MQLSVASIFKSYGIQPVLNQVSFTLADGQRLGLVGPNGVGKSTLLKIIMGQLEADSGKVNLPADATLGYLPQSIEDFGDKTLQDLVAESMQHLHTLEQRMRQLEEQMAIVQKPALDTILLDYEAAIEQFERYGGYEMDYRVDQVLDGLGVGRIPRERAVATLSGGEKARVSLAMLLLKAPDLLILDEPTNHLDASCLTWLEGYLQGYRGAILIVSHDREFLNRTVTAIMEIEEHSRQAKHYTDNYDAFLQAKALERRRWQEDYERQQEEMKRLRHEIKTTARFVAHNRPARDNDKFLKHFKRAQVEGSISSKVHSAEEKLRRLEENAIPQPPEALSFSPDFDPQTLKGHTPLSVYGLHKSFGSRCILDDVSFGVDARSRILLVGPNGAGKSTLLKTLAGWEKPDAGDVYVNPQVKIGYLDQEQETLDLGKTVLEAYKEGLPDQEQHLISQLLGSGLFRYVELNRKVGELSNGQRRKLQIARLMAERCNCLLLDEPTNYVSFDVLESFETALRDFPGPVIAASHDRRFIDNFGGEIWELGEGRLVKRIMRAENLEFSELDS